MAKETICSVTYDIKMMNENQWPDAITYLPTEEMGNRYVLLMSGKECI